MTKSSLVNRLTSILLSACITTSGYSQVSEGFKTAPYPAIDSSKNSKAVEENFAQAIQRYSVKKATGQLTASDVEVAAAAMKTAFDNLEETGYNASLEKQLVGDEDIFLRYHPTDQDLLGLQKSLANRGLQARVDRLKAVMDISDENKAAFLQTVRSQGLYKTEMQVVEEFRTQELEAVSTPSLTNARLVPSRGSQQAAKKKNVGFIPYAAAFCFTSAAVGLAGGCTVTLTLCFTAVAACSACAISSCGF